MILTRNKRLYLPPRYRVDQEEERESEKRTKEEKRQIRKKANEILVKHFGSRGPSTPLTNIITFDKGADGTISNGSFVPGETSVKAVSGLNGICSQLSGLGIIDTIQAGNSFAFFQGQNDINADTWKIKGQADVTAFSGINMLIILLGITRSIKTNPFDWSGGVEVVTAGISVAKNAEGNLNIRFHYNGAGSLQTPGIFLNKWPLAATTPIKYEIESDGTCLIFRFDTDQILGATEITSVLLTSVTFGAGLFPFFGQTRSDVNYEMVVEYDFKEGFG